MRPIVLRTILATVAVLGVLWAERLFAGEELPTKFTNRGGIVNTRHNMTQSTIVGPDTYIGTMTDVRNDYVEVCVYCHTPHGASTAIAAPLWNHTIDTATPYTTYESATLASTPDQPGPASLTCLSCHDGVTAIDSVINKPGSGGYSKAQETSVSPTFLRAYTNTWNFSMGGRRASDHFNFVGCMSCHSASAVNSSSATSFDAFLIGKDLRNDHPVGVRMPNNDDYVQPGAEIGSIAIIGPSDGTSKPTDRLRLYKSGDKFKVECASCHDPHGVRESEASDRLLPSFLRKSNEASGVCLTCHTK